MDFIDLIKGKARRLDSVPDEFLSSVKKSQREVYEAVLQMLSEMEVKGGQFIASKKNLELAYKINERLKGVMAAGDYGKALSKFAMEFDVQADLNLNYFNEAFNITAAPEVATVLLNAAKVNAVDLLINRAADSEFLYPIRDIIEQSVVNNAGYSETLQTLRAFIEGNDEVEGRLLKYSRGIAHDTFAVADASAVSAYAAEYGMEWFFYLGGEMDTTRPFCSERIGKFFHQKEVEAWGAGERTTGMVWPKDGGWGGRMDGTNSSTIFSTRGGYNCGHVISPVSEAVVPADVIARVRAQGFID